MWFFGKKKQNVSVRQEGAKVKPQERIQELEAQILANQLTFQVERERILLEGWNLALDHGWESRKTPMHTFAEAKLRHERIRR